MPFVKLDPIAETRELQEMFKDNPEAKEEFRQFELDHIETARLEREELELRNRLVAYKKAKKITQKDIEVRSGMSQQAISRLETSIDTIPNLKTLVRYAEAMDCILVPQDR